VITISKKQTTPYYTYNELKEAAIIYYLRNILEQKSKIELLKLLESNYYPQLLSLLICPFEYLGDVETELKQLNKMGRYLNINIFFQTKKDYYNFVENIIDKFCLTFGVSGISDNNKTYYYLKDKLE
jgi:hypothetical protein